MESNATSQVLLSTKRQLAPDEELEINLDLPEPPSKKAKRREKKARSSTSVVKHIVKIDGNEDPGPSHVAPSAEQAKTAAEATQAVPKRTDYGIWMGNLPFTATKETVRDFLREQGGIEENDVVRVHLPTTAIAGAPSGKKTQNKGFAYIDFTSKVAMELGLSLSERLFHGRRVLIKNAKSFEGRPEKTEKGSDVVSSNKASGREPTKKIFVGNLGFDVTKEDLIEHFSQAGQVEDIFVATFEDSGKCKGFAWLRFAALEAAQAAVKGFIYRDPLNDSFDKDSDEDKNNPENIVEKDGADGHPSKVHGQKHRKQRKWFINRLNGRQLRCEFAEDAQARYKRRFGKDSKAAADKATSEIVEVDNQAAEPIADQPSGAVKRKSLPAKSRPDKEQRREDRRRRHEKLDARTIAPGNALANAPRASGAIIAGKGTKMVFDD